MTSRSRRTVLQLCAGGAILTTSGCTSAFTETETESNDTIRFCAATVTNHDESAHAVQIRLADADRVLYEDDVTVEASGEQQGYDTVRIDADEIPAHEGAFTFGVKLNDTDWEEYDMTAIESDPASVMAVIDDAETISFLTSSEGNIDCSFLDTYDDEQ